MEKVMRFEELICWQRARTLVRVIRFLDIAQSSAVDVQNLSYIAGDRAYLSPEEVNGICNLAKETEELTLGLLRYLHRRTENTPGWVHEPAGDYFPESASLKEDWSLPDDFAHVST